MKMLENVTKWSIGSNSSHSTYLVQIIMYVLQHRNQEMHLLSETTTSDKESAEIVSLIVREEEFCVACFM